MGINTANLPQASYYDSIGLLAICDALESVEGIPSTSYLPIPTKLLSAYETVTRITSKGSSNSNDNKDRVLPQIYPPRRELKDNYPSAASLQHMFLSHTPAYLSGDVSYGFIQQQQQHQFGLQQAELQKRFLIFQQHQQRELERERLLREQEELENQKREDSEPTSLETPDTKDDAGPGPGSGPGAGSGSGSGNGTGAEPATGTSPRPTASPSAGTGNGPNLSTAANSNAGNNSTTSRVGSGASTGAITAATIVRPNNTSGLGGANAAAGGNRSGFGTPGAPRAPGNGINQAPSVSYSNAPLKNTPTPSLSVGTMNNNHKLGIPTTASTASPSITNTPSPSAGSVGSPTPVAPSPNLAAAVAANANRERATPPVQTPTPSTPASPLLSKPPMTPGGVKPVQTPQDSSSYPTANGTASQPSTPNPSSAAFSMSTLNMRKSSGVDKPKKTGPPAAPNVRTSKAEGHYKTEECPVCLRTFKGPKASTHKQQHVRRLHFDQYTPKRGGKKKIVPPTSTPGGEGTTTPASASPAPATTAIPDMTTQPNRPLEAADPSI
ncbi:hypothetical protein AWJ20_5339 [Sugiyamaella lignohabitans]|uniref:Uncharacterized protein n=1 Tax=Sugiyamaella lignohabitans TaxID=796027 RepID=A0A167ER01_9ASCO|nr:uncharacterized protein AWJ20_5339 [Sugiyamaella lignohabitans]ANB14368.1 hypothetical protein AWJ20_5339 [Sugiyamaella lignohabitans]